MESFEYSGKWWLPTGPETEVSGTLFFSNQDGIHLELNGAFTAYPSWETCPIILGITREHGRTVTLHNCTEIGRQGSYPGYERQRFYVRVAYVGRYGPHFSDAKDLRFSKVQVRYSHLTDWVNLSGFNKPRCNTESHEYEFAYTLPESVRATTSRGTVSVFFGFNYGGEGSRELNLRESVGIQIETPEALSLEDSYFGYIYPIQNLLTLATDAPNSIDGVAVFAKQDSRELPLQVYFRTGYGEVQGRHLHPSGMLFLFEDIAASFSAHIERWLKIADELDSVLDLFFGTRYNPRMYPENRFLNVVQAIEAYHRRRIGGLVLPEEEHQERITEILAKAPEEHRKWLKSKLLYSNEPSLRRRMKELVIRTEGVILPLVGNKNTFVHRVVITRNYLIHQDPSAKDEAAGGAELERITDVLSILLQACLLEELGFSSARSAQLFDNSSAYRRMIAGVKRQAVDG